MTSLQKFLILLFLIPLISSAREHKEVSWNLKKKENGISVYSRKQPDKRIHEYKVETIINADLEVTYERIINFKGNNKFLETVSSVKVLKYYADSLIQVYLVFDMPWPLKDRDITIDMKIDKNADTVKLNSEPATGIVPQKENLVRLKDYSETWIIERLTSGKTRITLWGHADPGGDIPAWIVNMFIEKEPFNLVSGIKTLLENDS